MALRIYNTLTKSKEEFQPVTPGKVTIYLCGPTVYKESHIGHLVGPIIFDAFKRFLQYKGYDVRLIVNITDVEDKLIDQARLEGVPMDELAERITEMYFDSLRQLDAYDSVDEFPRATDNIDEIIKMVAGLIDKGLAYIVDGDVYYDLAKFDDYGQLSRRKREEQLAGSRQLQGKARSPGDFSLWKESKEDEPGWDSPWGRGRPGWHIECSAMSMKYLGKTIDIHGGGQDLIFPHHENEIAQSEGYTGQCFVKYWMHNGLTRIPTKTAGGAWKKMSKSLGNIKPISEVLSRYDGQTVRFFVLSTHYRRPIPYSDQELDNAAKAMRYFNELFNVIEHMTGVDPYSLDEPSEVPPELVGFGKEVLRIRDSFLQYLDDDFNTAGAIGVLFDLGRKTRNLTSQKSAELVTDEQFLWVTGMIIYLGRLLGLFLHKPPWQKQLGELQEKLAQLLIDLSGSDKTANDLRTTDAKRPLELLIEMRDCARDKSDYKTADTIRNRLTELGITLEDVQGRTIWHM